MRMRVPPTAGPRDVSWMAMTARRPATASWTRITSSWPISRAIPRAFMGARVVREHKRLGQVLQELRILDEHLLEDSLALHVREVLRKTFGWEAGAYSFEAQPADARRQEDATLKVFTGEVILEAARSVNDPAAVRRALGDPDRLLSLSTDPVLRFQQISLSGPEIDVLALVDGTRTQRQLVAALSLPPEETERSLLGLLCLGLVKRAPVT